MHQHKDSSHDHQHPGFVLRHLILFVIAIAVVVGVYWVTRNANAATTSALLFILAHVAIATGVVFVGRKFLGKFIQKIHGSPTTHTHTHADDALETDGVTISWARFYDVLVRVILGGQQKKFIQSAITLAQIQPGEKVLDVGCGTGTLAIATKRSVPANVQIYGRDAAPEMINRAHQKAVKAGIDVDFKPGLVENMEFDDHTFDLVMNSLMVHHLPGDLRVRAFAEIFRVLKPGGRVLIVDFEPPKKGFTRTFLSLLLGGEGMMTIDNSQIPPLLTAAGFTNVRMTPTDSALATAILGIKPG